MGGLQYFSAAVSAEKLPENFGKYPNFLDPKLYSGDFNSIPLWYIRVRTDANIFGACVYVQAYMDTTLP